MPQAILNSSWRQHPTKQQLYDHQPSITKTIKIRRTRHAGHGWRSRDELISDVFLWTPTAKARRPIRTYIQQLCEDTGCSREDLPKTMNDRECWRERVKDIRADGTTRWWDDDGVVIETKLLILSKYSKLTQRGYKIRHDWMGKVIHRKCARNWNLTILPYANQILSKRTKCVKLPGNLRYKQIT